MTSQRHIMRAAWRLARKGSRRFGGRPSEFFRVALVIAWKEARAAALGVLGRLESPRNGRPDGRPVLAMGRPLGRLLALAQTALDNRDNRADNPSIGNETNGVETMWTGYIFNRYVIGAAAVAMFAYPWIMEAARTLQNVADTLSTLPGVIH